MLNTHVKGELEALARRNQQKLIDAEPKADNGYIAYTRDRDGWGYVWSTGFDAENELLFALEIMAYDCDSMKNSIPACIVKAVFRLEKWEAIMAMDPENDPTYYDPA